MRAKYLAVQRTMLPVDYDHCNRSSVKGYYQWKMYITSELAKDLSPMEFWFAQCQKILAEKTIVSNYNIPVVIKKEKQNLVTKMIIAEVVLFILLITCVYLRKEFYNV